MDASLIPATAVAMGSAIGASVSIFTTWITQRVESSRKHLEKTHRARETLYGEFITEASRLAMEALSHSLEQTGSLVKLYGILGRIRLVATEPVLSAGEACCRQIIEFYTGPNLTLAQIQAAIDAHQFDPTKQFSAACRKELFQSLGR